MNVKISSGALRFKIMAEELDQLKSGKTLKETLRIGRRNFAIAIDPVGANDDLAVIYDEDMVRLVLSPGRVSALAGLGRSREGLEQTIGDLAIALQVDFRTQKRQAS